MTTLSHTMHGALEYVRAGVKPKEAARTVGVSLQGLYRAMRREGLRGTRPRCPACNRIVPGSVQPAGEDATIP